MEERRYGLREQKDPTPQETEAAEQQLALRESLPTRQAPGTVREHSVGIHACYVLVVESGPQVQRWVMEERRYGLREQKVPTPEETEAAEQQPELRESLLTQQAPGIVREHSVLSAQKERQSRTLLAARPEQSLVPGRTVVQGLWLRL
jgi:hypothetical protein